MEIYEFSSSSSEIDIDEEEEKSNSCNNVNKVKNKKRYNSSGKKEYFSSSDSSDAQNEGNGSKKKKIRKKIKRDIESSTVESSIPRRASKGRSDVTKPGPSLKPSHDTGAFGFESEAIFSQVLKCENESVFSGEDSDQTVKSSGDNDDKEAKEKVSARVPSFNLTFSDEEMETDDGLPKLVSKHKKHDKSNTAVVKDTAKSESGNSMFSGKGGKLCKHDIEDKEFWSDQEMTSSDDDVPILQLNPQNLNVSSDDIKCVETLEEVTSCSSKEIKDKTDMEQDQIFTSSKISFDFSSSCSKKLSLQLSTNCKQKLQMAAESSTQLKGTSESELITNDVHVESDDETQPFDDFDLPDLSPPHGEKQLTNLQTEREHSPDIFNEEDPPNCTDGAIYTQMDDCIYIEDSDEENLSQSLFQQEVKLELDVSSEDEVYLVDEEDESWRDILSLDDSDDDNITHNGRVHEMPDPDNTTDSVYKAATQVDADPYAGATQVITEDSYSSATQIDSKNMYLSETQVDKRDPYSSATQMDHDLHSSESDDDIYNAATQVDGSEVKVRKTKKLSKGQDLFGRFAIADSDSNDESVKYERDPYASATQLDLPSASATKVIKNRILKATKKMDPYMCATQCDKGSYVCETQVDQMDPYTGATQIDSLSRKSPKNSISSPAYKVSSEKYLINEPTQKEASCVDPYDLATQVDSANQGHLSNYDAEMEAFFDSDDDDIILLSETESPEAIELSQNQTENKACVVTETCGELRTKSEKMINGGGIKNEKSTGVIELATGSDEDEDGRKTRSKIPESMDTKFMRGNQKDRNVFDDLCEMDTQVVEHNGKVQNDNTLSSESWSDMEFYEVDTQLDSLSELKKTVSLKETSPIDSKSGHQKTVSSKENIDLDFPSGLQKTLSSTENNIKDTSDQSDHLLLSASSSSHMTSCSKTAAKSSMLPESSEQSSSDFEIVRSANEEMPAKNKSTSQGHSTYHVPKRTISTNQKTVIPISPQRQKSTKEKREEFKITSFYSKKQMDSETSGRVGKSGNTEAETLQKKRSSVPAKTTPDAGWLSKTSGKTNDRKRNRTASGGGTRAKKRKDEVTSTVNLDAVIKAKAEMIARNWIRPLVPEPVKKPSIDTKSGFTDDVRMPELDEVIKKQLPLMDDRLLHPKKTNQDDLQVISDSGDATVGSKAKSSMDSSCSKENQMKYSSEYKKSNSRSGSKDSDGKDVNGAEICVNDSKRTILKDRHHSKQHKSSSTSSSVDSDKSREKTAIEKDTLLREKDNTKRSTSLNKDSSEQRTSKEKDSLRRSTSKDKDSSTKSSSKEKDNSRRSTSKEKDVSSTKSSSKEKDSSRRSTSKDKDSSTKSSSMERDTSRRSTSKDKDISSAKSSSKDSSRRSTSKDKDISSAKSSSKDSSRRSTPKDKNSSTKSSSKEKEKSIRSTSTNKESSRKSSSKDKDNSRRSTSMDKDISSQSSSMDKDKSRSSSKENVSKSYDSRGPTSKDKDRSKHSKSKTKDNSGRSSSKERSNSLDVSKSSSAFCSNHSDILSSSIDRNRIESEALENTAHSEILPFVFNSDQNSENTKTAPNNSESSSVSLKAGDDSEKHRMEICSEQGNEIQEEDMEDVKLGKLAKAAAIEKPLPSSQDQLEEDDDAHVIIIDDEEEIDEEKTSCRKAPGSTKNTSDIKSILNKKFCTFFADRNDESTRKGQLIKFKLAPDRVSVRTQRYIEALIQKKKGGVKSVQTNRLPTTSRPPLHPLPDARRLSATATSHSPSNVPQLPAKMAAHSSMDSSCVSVPSGPPRSSASERPGPERSSSQNVDHCSQFFSHLLNWNPAWFSEADKKEQRKSYEPPPVSPTVYPIPEKFNSYKDYVDIFIPHLLQEAWEQSYQSWSQLKTLNSYPQICAVYSGVERNSTTATNQTFEKCTWYSITTKNTYETMKKNDHLGEKVLVIIKDYGHYLKSKDKVMDQKYYQPNYFDQIGYIEKIQPQSRPGSLEQTINTFKVLGTDPAARQKSAEVLCITILSRRRPRFNHLLDKLSFIQPVASLVTTVRQFQAVSFLPRSPVCKHILLPGQQDVFYEKITVSESVKHSLKQYNESQQLAICTASQMILGDPQSPKIGLLQGPPGTGKSSTVVGIVEKVLQFLGSNVRICLCAPSNNAVDLLIKRLDDHRKKMVNTEFASALSIVRIGNAECVHRDVKKFRLSDIFQEECIKRRTEKKKEHIPRSVLENYHELKRRHKELQELRRQRQGHREEVVRINADLEKLEKRITDMEKNHFIQINDITLSRAEEEQIRRGILKRATIVCGTLSAFGQPFVSYLLTNSAKRGKPIFDCIIVDEASQANELDCIIPLQYQANKLILVGDPEQLPPTIKSSKAAQNYFGQSLFERFYRHFQSSTMNLSPILMLDTQYRMHPDIAYWPSQYIYQGKLKTDRSVINRYKQNAWLKPFVLFDVQDSHENLSQTTGSVNNPTEVEFIVQLVLVILKSTRPQHVGIIAPYKSQKQLLSTSLAKKGVRNIEISTVDGFQGQEKEVIVFSCVRAKNQSKSIGFMADKKRLNVALTRAKSALYIVAHMDSLKEADADWRNMIEDAERRHLIHTVASTREFPSAVTQIVLKK